MTFINILLAALPLVLILILMLGFRWNGAKAGAVGWIAAMVLAVLRFAANGTFIFWAQVEGFFRALQVLYIIWGALFFFRITEANGSLNAMSTMLQHISPGKIFQVLLLGWAFTGFLQGVGGFGVPVAVVAPIMMGLGFPPLEAVVLPSLGHAWAVSFGSLGASFEALKTATGLTGTVIAPPMAVVLGLLCFLDGFLVLWIAGGGKTVRAGLWPMLGMAVMMSGVQCLAVYAGLYNIAAMLGALAGLIVGVAWALRRQNERSYPVSVFPNAQSLISIAPYLLLLVIIFGVNFIPTLSATLNKFSVQFSIPALTLANGRNIAAGKTKAFAPFGHPGALLFYSGLLTLLLSKRQGMLPSGSGRKIWAGMRRSGVQSSLGIMAMVAMATTMENAGMVTVLAGAMANIAGSLFPFISPFIGALGAFMTGSNTNSNVIFGAFQQQVAQTLGYSIPVILAIHNAGAAVGSIFAPAKIIVGCSTVGLHNQEGEVLRSTTRYSLILLLILALGASRVLHLP